MSDWREHLGWPRWRVGAEDLTNDEDFDAVADEREAYVQRRGCAHDFGMLGVCVRCGENDPRWDRVPQLTLKSLELSSLLGPVSEAIYMGDRLESLDQDTADLRARAAREPLGVDISDYSDEYCAGFLAGQVNALDELDRR